MSAQPSEAPIWQNLDNQLQDDGRSSGGVWEQLKEATSPSNYRPIQVDGMAHRKLESRRDGTYHMLNNPRAATYLKLDERDYYLWCLMDGSYSVKDLVVADFSKNGSIAFARVSDLVTQLQAASFLTDPPVNIYSQIAH